MSYFTEDQIQWMQSIGGYRNIHDEWYIPTIQETDITIGIQENLYTVKIHDRGYRIKAIAQSVNLKNAILMAMQQYQRLSADIVSTVKALDSFHGKMESLDIPMERK